MLNKSAKMMNIQAVLTGDIIKSSKIVETEVLLEGIKDTFHEINKKVLNNKAFFEMYRGDSFQLLLPQVEKSLLTAMLLKSRLRGITVGGKFNYSKAGKIQTRQHRFPPVHVEQLWDARISIGIGKVSYLGENIKESQGEAFTFSGHELDSLKKEDKTLILKTPWSDVNDEFEVSIYLADAIIRKWSAVSSETMYHALLEEKTQTELVKLLDVSQPAIHKRLVRANEDAISKLIKRFEKVIQKKTYD